MENHIHRHAQVGTWVLINARRYNRKIGNGLMARLKKGKYRINRFHLELAAARHGAEAGRIED
jgi:hypothetical protein